MNLVFFPKVRISEARPEQSAKRKQGECKVPGHTVLMYQRKAGKKNYSTQYSRVVPHHSTDCAITSLTSEIRRDPVLSGVYGRSWKSLAHMAEVHFWTAPSRLPCPHISGKFSNKTTGNSKAKPPLKLKGKFYIN
jgi:hypothetical protein